MRRRAFDPLGSTAGAVMALLLAVAGGLLLWAHGFVDSNVARYVTPSAGQRVTDGAQAEVLADHYIAVHLLLAVLSALGLRHSRHGPEQTELFDGHRHAATGTTARPAEAAGV